ncbi:phage terminase large subunit, partial [Patescibacteria group bacterium]|nr:phage terminase large subunit [Patescibacteria group bacterium]
MPTIKLQEWTKERLEEIKDEIAALLRELPERESLRLFIRVLRPLIAGWVDPGAIHDDIIDGLLSQHRRTLIIATRYSAKSTLTSMYVAWLIFRDPLIKILVVSKGAALAKRMLRTVRIVYLQNCPLLEHLLPNDDCLDNAEQFQTVQSLTVATGGVTFTSVGLASNIVGLRSDITIADDVEGPADDTPEKVVALEETLNELHMINPKGRKIMLGTYQSEFSIYAKLADLVDREGEAIWEEHRALMFSEEDDGTGRVTITSRWIGMFTDADGLDWRRSVTARAWRLHALLEADPSILHEKPLKISDLILMDHPPSSREFPLTVERGGAVRDDIGTWSAPKGDVWVGPRSTSSDMAPYAATVCAIDPASGLAGRDAIGVAILSITAQGLGVIRHLEGVRRPTKAESMRRLATIIRDFACTQLVVEETEAGFFGETLEGELVLVGYPMTAEKIKSGQLSKGRRIIEALAPPMGAGRIVILEAVARSDHGGEFVSQLTRVTYDGKTGKARSQHDDIVDALAHAVAA